MSAVPSRFFYVREEKTAAAVPHLGYAPDCEYLGDWPESNPRLHDSANGPAAHLRQGSAVDPPLHVGGVALAFDIDLVGGRGDLLKVLGGELDVDCVSVFLQAVGLGGAGDGHDPRVLGQQPGQRHLRDGGTLTCGDRR